MIAICKDCKCGSKNSNGSYSCLRKITFTDDCIHFVPALFSVNVSGPTLRFFSDFLFNEIEEFKAIIVDVKEKTDLTFSDYEYVDFLTTKVLKLENLLSCINSATKAD